MSSREITVKGVGKTTVKPDLIILNMNLEVSEPEYEATMRRSTEDLDLLRAAIVSAGHDGKDLKTVSFNINTKYESYRDEDEWKQRFVGYTCSHALKLAFDLNIPILGTTLNAIAGCEANPDYNIKFTIKDPSAVSATLLENAIENATGKAAILAKSADVKLGAIQRIDYNWSDIHLHSETKMCMDMMEAHTPMAIDIEPEDINVNDSVTVVWAIE